MLQAVVTPEEDPCYEREVTVFPFLSDNVVSHPQSLCQPAQSTPHHSRARRQNMNPEGLQHVDQRLLFTKVSMAYLDALRKRFKDKPEVYNSFLDLMSAFKNGAYVKSFCLLELCH